MSPIMVMGFFLLGGVGAGTLAGLLGIGGGLIYVPLLVWVLPHIGVPETITMHLAVATSLTVILVTSCSSAYAHHRRGGVQWSIFRAMVPGLVIGAVLGPMIADVLPSKTLKIFFGVFVLLLAIRMALDLQPKPTRHLPGKTGLGIVGFIFGILCTLLGMGGGTLTVPFLRFCNIDVRKAVATSASVGVPIALPGMLSFMVAGLNEPGLPAWTTGYIYWPAFVGLATASVVCAPLGARLAHKISTKLLTRIFAIFLLLVAFDMIM